MAPAEESAYLPSLKACLDGTQEILTWKLIALGLDASRLHPLDPTIIRHIEDPAAIQVITNCFNPAKPDYQSKAQFDTLTSAVNITPSPNGQYDMKTLKDDASWLSQTTKIDEVLALRITILEWQSRLGRQAAMNLEESGLKEFNSVKMRRQRLLEVLFEEQSWLLRCVEIIIERGVYGPLKQQDTSSESAVIKNLATALTESWNLAPMQHDGSWFNLIRDYLQLQVDSVQSGVNLFSPDDMQDYFTEHLFTLCIETSIVQVVHGLQIILIIQRSFHSLSAPQLVVDWFLWMDTTEFLHPWLSRIPTHFTRFKSAASELLVLGSLAFIDLSGAYTILPNLAAASTAKRGQDVEVYLQSISCVTEINRILEHHIGNDNEIAAPAGIAWCSLLNNIHVHATQSIEHRESRQTQSSIDNYGANQQSDGESPDESASRRSTQLNRRPSWGSDTSGQAVLFEEIDETVRNNPRGEEIIKLLGDHAANNLGGFSIIETIARSCSSRLDYDTSPELTTCIREILVEFIKTSIELGSLTYSQTVLNILFTILAGKDGHWKFRARGSPSPYPFGASCQSLGDDPLLRDLMACARGRFPHEGVPFIELCRTLLPYQDFKSTDGHVLLEILSEISTYTALLEESQLPYDLTGEGETLQLRLLCPVDVIAMTLPGLLSHSTVATSGSFDTLVMPAGTTGQPLKEDKPIIALWNFKYSGLTFWGLLLQLQLQSRPDSKRNHINESHSRLISMNTEIITFLATWIMKITTECENQHASEKTQALLENISDDLDRNQDIVAIIFALLEGELYKDVSKSFEAEFIFRCIQFLVALTKVMPGRVWSFLSRSGLLGLYGKESRLSTIIAAVEVSNGSYDILLSSTQLLDILIEDSIRGTSSLKSSAVALKRFRTFDSNTSGSGIQASTMSKILHQFTRIMVDAFETSPNWNFKSQEHELSLKLGTYRVLRKIISYAFEFDDESSPEQKVSASLGSAANYLLENFLSEAASDTLLQPLFQELADIVIKPSTSLSSRISTLCHSVAFASLELIIQLIRLNCFLGYSTSNVTKKVHENIQLLVNLFVLYDDLRSPVVRTLDAAIRDIGRNSRPAPILEALSEPTAKAFIECLETLGLSETNPSLSAATWSFFSNAIMRKQQWVAVYLLLGKTPRESLKSSSGSSTNSIIYLASKRIANLEILDPEEALKLLEFVTYSANFSVDIMIEIVKNKECRASCLRYLSNLQPVKKDVDINAKIPTKFQIAAYIVDILALLVNKSNQGKDKTILMHLIPNIKYLIEHGASSPLYNSSLHHTIQKNFEELFPGRSLRHFKKTNFSQPKLGDQFYYDKALADTIFNQNQAWTGKMGKGFNREFTRANINLSLVEAQINLFHSWRSLAIELAEGLGNDLSFQETMISVIKNCLKANQECNMPEAIFKKLCISRAELAFYLLQRLLEVKSNNEEIKSILQPAWNSVQLNITELGPTLANEGADYVRTLLRILYLSLSANEIGTVDSTTVENNSTFIALDILQTIVARGFRSLIGQLHEDSSQVQPGDFAMIIAILRVSLRLPGVTNHADRLLAHFAIEKTIQHAGTLVSWSDQLAMAGDPVYGELSISFLLELSNVQALAESIIVNGTFSQISSTKLFSYFRRAGGFGPFINPTRMYNIWSRGYLPLVLNIVGAIGAPVAIEIATIFTQFAPQLKLASEHFDLTSATSINPRITLSMVNEVHSLALLNMALNKFCEAGASLGILPTELPQLQWNAASVKEDLESLLGRRHALRDSIVPTDEKEEAWAQQRPSDTKEKAQNRLEEMIVEEISAALVLLGNISAS